MKFIFSFEFAPTPNIFLLNSLHEMLRSTSDSALSNPTKGALPRSMPQTQWAQKPDFEIIVSWEKPRSFARMDYGRVIECGDCSVWAIFRKVQEQYQCSTSFGNF